MKQILVVDNDRIFLKSMTRLLEKEGHQVIEAEDGLKALDIMKTVTPDIIFVDLVMPIIDGMMLCKIINNIEGLKNAKVIILSAIAAEERTDFSQLGVSACIAKGPFNETANYILDVINRLDLDATQNLSEEIFGLETLHPRGITEELLTANRHFEIILEKMTEGVVGINLEGRIVYANPSIFSLLNLQAHQLFGLYFIDLFSGDDHKRISKLMEKKGEKPQTISDDFPLMLKDRLITIDYLPLKQYGFSRIIINDITERKRGEEALRREKETFRILVNESPLGISLIGENHCFNYINPKFIEIFGYTLDDIPTTREWFAKAYPDPIYRERVMLDWTDDIKNSISAKSRIRTFPVICKDGSEKTILFRPTILENGDRLVFYEDITDQSRLQTQLEQAQKMEAIGTLAGGIAHDFNNLMMAILGNASLMLLKTESSHPHYEKLKTIENQVNSGIKLTEQLLGYARKGKYYVKPLNLNRLLHDALDTFSRTRKEITLHFELAGEVFSIEADEGQLEQVLLNLYVNAADAMPGGGDLFLKTMNVTHQEIKNKPYKPLPGTYVLLQVTDTGLGIDKETQKKIFDPFFTTKEMGRGTGLGLASVYGIVKGHGGYIDVESKERQGTTFNIYLPASDKKITKQAAPSGQIIKGNETILIVDDEEIVLTVSVEMLKSFGYSVLAAKDGNEAIRLFTDNRDEIELVVLDMVMPGMSGGDVYDRIKGIKATVKVLLSSGYSIDGQAKKILERGCDDFIQKPFNLKSLSEKIRGLLDMP